MATSAGVTSSSSVPYETQLRIRRQSIYSVVDYSITDEEGNKVFIMDNDGSIFSKKGRIYDAESGRLLVTVRKKSSFLEGPSWVAFRGDIEIESQLMFVVRRRAFGSTGFDGFLSKNSYSSLPDFSLKRTSWSSKFTISADGTTIAEARKTGWVGFTLTVHPGVDRAFVTAVALCWMERLRSEGA